jgi:hypothetical protein
MYRGSGVTGQLNPARGTGRQRDPFPIPPGREKPKTTLSAALCKRWVLRLRLPIPGTEALHATDSVALA